MATTRAASDDELRRLPAARGRGDTRAGDHHRRDQERGTAWRFPTGTGPFDWRVSIADVATSGAFSALPGIDRVLALLDGPAMALTVDGVAHELMRGAPFAFDGGAATSCRLPA
jgi:hypothetical protein